MIMKPGNYRNIHPSSLIWVDRRCFLDDARLRRWASFHRRLLNMLNKKCFFLVDCDLQVIIWTTNSSWNRIIANISRSGWGEVIWTPLRFSKQLKFHTRSPSPRFTGVYLRRSSWLSTNAWRIIPNILSPWKSTTTIKS